MKKNIGCFILPLTIVTLIVYFFLREYIRNLELEKFGRYTIGITFDKSTGSKGKWYIDYFFYYKKIRYTGFKDLKSNVTVPNGRYYVLFSSKHPQINTIFFDKQVFDTIKVAPIEGWSKIP